MTNLANIYENKLTNWQDLTYLSLGSKGYIVRHVISTSCFSLDNSSPVTLSQMLMKLSLLPLTRRLQSWVSSTQVTHPLWPVNQIVINFCSKTDSRQTTDLIVYDDT